MPGPLLVVLSPLAVLAADLDPPPADEDVKAGYPALFLFLALLAVIGLLGWSLIRHLRRAEANRDAGLFGEPSQRSDGAALGSTDEDTAEVHQGEIPQTPHRPQQPQ